MKTVGRDGCTPHNSETSEKHRRSKYLPLSKLPLVYIQPNWLGFAHRRFHSYSRTFRGDTPTTTGWETTISIIDTNRPEIGFSPPRDTCFFETLFSSSSSPPPIPSPLPPSSTVSQFPRRLFPGRRADHP